MSATVYGTTPSYQLPYPEQSDPADVPVDIRELADRLEVVLAQLDAQLDAVQAGAAGVAPVGAAIPWLVSSIPAGYLEFNGQAITQATYPKLYALFGANLPNLRDRVLLGAGASYGDGVQGGEVNHVLSAAEMPSHSHGVARSTVAYSGNPGVPLASHSPAPNTAEDFFSGYVGGGAAHNNMQPFRAVRWITVAG